MFQRRALRLERPDLRKELRRAPLAVTAVKPRAAEALIELARASMVTRARDLYSFKYSDPRDVRMIECGDGLQFACIGLVPERRLMLEAVYAFLMLKNGVPIGYVLVSSLFHSAEIAYNVFESFRGGERLHLRARARGGAARVWRGRVRHRSVSAWARERGRFEVGRVVVLLQIGISAARSGRVARRRRRVGGDEEEPATSLGHADVGSDSRPQKFSITQGGRVRMGSVGCRWERSEQGVALFGGAIRRGARRRDARLWSRGNETLGLTSLRVSTRMSGVLGSDGARW